MPRTSYPRDRFDDPPADSDRVGAHRSENPHLRGWIVLLWAIVATVVLVAAGIFGSLVVSGRVTLFPTATPVITPSQTPTIPARIDTSYTVLVLNATGVGGQGAPVKNVIVAAGWSPDNVLVSDATAPFKTTTVYYAQPEDAPAAAGLAKAIGGAAIAENSQYQPAGDPEAKQLSVVVGTDRVSPGPTSTR